MATDAPQQGDHILVVEDTNFMRLLLEKIITGYGHKVKTVTSGTAALDEMRKRIPKLLFLDLHLNDGSGLDVCRALRAETTYQKLPIIVCTIDHTRTAVEAAIAAGATDFLCKPVDKTNVGERLMKHLGPMAAPGLKKETAS